MERRIALNVSLSPPFSRKQEKGLSFAWREFHVISALVYTPGKGTNNNM